MFDRFGLVGSGWSGVDPWMNRLKLMTPFRQWVARRFFMLFICLSASNQSSKPWRMSAHTYGDARKYEIAIKDRGNCFLADAEGFRCRFDRPKHYSAYVKSRSFAKAEDSKYIIISDEGEVESLKGELSGYDDLDEVIRKACLGRTPRTTEEEMERSHAELPTDLTSPKDHITLNNALSVLKK